MNNCACGIESKVPLNWQAFLTDQRGPRQSHALSERAQALWTGVRDYTREEYQALDEARNKVEMKSLKRDRLSDRKRKSVDDINIMFEKVPIDTSEEVNDESESEWEDIREEKGKDTRNYNKISLKILHERWTNINGVIEEQQKYLMVC